MTRRWKVKERQWKGGGRPRKTSVAPLESTQVVHCAATNKVCLVFDGVMCVSETKLEKFGMKHELKPRSSQVMTRTSPNIKHVVGKQAKQLIVNNLNDRECLASRVVIELNLSIPWAQFRAEFQPPGCF